MKVYETIEKFREYQKANLKQSSYKSYELILEKFVGKYGEHDITEITSENVSSFVNELSLNSAQATKHLRFSQIKAFFNLRIVGVGLTFALKKIEV